MTNAATRKTPSSQLNSLQNPSQQQTNSWDESASENLDNANQCDNLEGLGENKNNTSI